MAANCMKAIDRVRSTNHASLRPRSVARSLRCAVTAVCLAACAAFTPAPVRASGLLAPAVGAADNATMGTRIADPQTPSAALFENPAGLTGFETFTHGGGLGIAYGRGQIEA